VKVVALIKPTTSDKAQFFYRIRVPGGGGFSEKRSSTAPVSPKTDNEFVEVTFRVTSPTGFRDRFRFDPVAGYQRVTVKEIELSCR
jgi:hypothetical protein